MRLLVVAFCLTVTASYGQAQSTQVGGTSSANLGANLGGLGANASGSLSVSGSGASSARIDSLLNPMASLLGTEGIRALRNALMAVPLAVLNQVNSIGQLFGALATFNPSAVPILANQFFPGAMSTMQLYLPALSNAGMGMLRQFAASGSFGSSPFGAYFRQNFPANVGVSGLADGSTSLNGFASLNPANVANSFLGSGMAGFNGVTNSLAAGEPLSALLAMAGGAGDVANRFGNLAANGMNMASQGTSTASGLTSRFSSPLGQMSSAFSSMIPGNPGSTSAGTSFGGSASAQAGPVRASGQGSASFSSPMGNLMASNPFTSFLTGGR